MRSRIARLDSDLAELEASPNKLPERFQEAYDRFASGGKTDPQWAQALRGIQKSLDEFSFFTPRPDAPWYERALANPFAIITGAPGGLATVLG